MFNKANEVTCVLRNMQSYTMHPEVLKLKGAIQHGQTNRYDHSINVMKKALLIAGKLPFNIDLNELAIAALLHDFHTIDANQCINGRVWLAFHHPEIAAENAKELFNVTDKVYRAIRSHMFPFNFYWAPSSLIAIILGVADKACCMQEKHMAKKHKKVQIKVSQKIKEVY